MGKKIPVCFLLVFFCVLVLGGCKEKEALIVDSPSKEDPAQVEEVKYTAYCPLDGQGLTELPTGRPIAVMLGNNPSARPQFGLPEADLVYEFPAEGGITRFMALYYHNEAERIGPVRSARPYFMDRAFDWSAVFVHVGYSPQALVYFDANKVHHIDEFSSAKSFWRDKSRKAPDNLFTSTGNLRARMAELKYEGEKELWAFQFAPDALIGKGEEAKTIEIYYPEKMNRAAFRYDAQEKLYHRFTGGKPHVDGATNKHLQAKNIIIQYVKTKVMDSEGRLEVAMVGKGKIQFFSQGRVIQGTWAKESLKTPTYFYDEEGSPLTLNPGQTWIQVVGTGTKVVIDE